MDFKGYAWNRTCKYFKVLSQNIAGEFSVTLSGIQTSSSTYNWRTFSILDRPSQ
jgi:hypothetical protein